MSKLVIFQGHSEVIVTTTKKEASTICELFIDGGRLIDEYNRLESVEDAILINVHMQADVD